MFTHHASVLALGVLCSTSFGCGGSGVSLGGNGAGANAGNGGASEIAGAPGAGDSSGGSSAGGATHSGGSSAAGAASGGSNSGGSSSGGSTSSAGATSIAGAPGSAGAAGTGSSACQDPVPLGGNWLSCKNGLAHRTAPGKCEYKPRTTPIPATGPSDQCTLDSQCTAMPNGYCSYVSGNLATNANVCAYACLVDSDCGAGNVCVCGAVGGVCNYVAPGCKSDMDCTGGALCTNYDASPGCSAETFACQTPSDQCAADADCPQTSPVCTVTSGHRVCAPLSCAF